jgi:hypothetical protein
VCVREKGREREIVFVCVSACMHVMDRVIGTLQVVQVALLYMWCGLLGHVARVMDWMIA